MNISNDLLDKLQILVKTDFAIKSSSQSADTLLIAKSLRNFLSIDDQIIFDMIINHAMICENKVPLGFNNFLLKILNDEKYDDLKFRKFHISDLNYYLEKCRYETSKNFIDFIVNNRNLDSDIFFEKSNNNENYLELVNGYNFKGKNLLNLNSVSYLNCAVILIDGVILNISQIHHLLTYLNNTKIPTLLVCRDYENDVLNTLIVNYKKETLNVIPIKSSLDDLDNLNIFSDLSSVTNSDVISSLKGDLISSIKPENLKFIDKITFYNDNFVIENIRSEKSVQIQVNILKEKLKDLEKLKEFNKYSLLENRIKSLTSKNSIIKLKDDVNNQFIKNEINKILRLIKHGIKFGIEKNSYIPMSSYIVTKNHYDDFINTINGFELII